MVPRAVRKCFSMTGLALCFVGVLLTTGCGTSDDAAQEPDPPPLSDEELAALDEALADAEGKADGFGLIFFDSEYVNMAMAGETGSGDFALIAGSHDADFPYWGTQPWDNGLLLVAGEGYHFTHRTQRVALVIDANLGQEHGSGEIRYQGLMERASDGEQVEVDLSIPMKLTRFGIYQLGKRYNFLDCEKIPGMSWQPFQIEAETATVQIEGSDPIEITGINGELENGIVSNLRAADFALSYDYVSVAAPGDNGYGFVDFVSHPLYRNGVLGDILEWYMVRYASESLTLYDGQVYDGNAFDVYRPPQGDATVVLFENNVDLGLANLRRQMIATTDSWGTTLYGLREIFEPY